MMTNGTSQGTYEKGKALSEAVNPGMEEALAGRYDALVPGLSRTIVDVAYGQTRPQLKVNIAIARRVGASQREIGEVIFQMALYGGLPSMINAMNAALEVFDAEENNG